MNFVWIMIISCLIITTFLSLYGIATRPNMIKKIVLYSTFSDVINVFIILLGYRRSLNPRVPVLHLHPTSEEIAVFEMTSVDPIVQTLVLTAIVIGLAVMLFLTFLVIQVYRLYGTIDTREIAKKSRLRG